MGRPAKDFAGVRIGKLLGLHRVDDGGVRAPLWKLQCDCGTELVLPSNQLQSGTVSCGCHKRTGFRTRHGKARRNERPRIYSIWHGMKQRCQCPKQHHYVRYGGRGIKVCDRWQKFENFYADMGDPPSDNHSIDRIDPNGNYEPSNCRWATAREQRLNQRN